MFSFLQAAELRLNYSCSETVFPADSKLFFIHCHIYSEDMVALMLIIKSSRENHTQFLMYSFIYYIRDIKYQVAQTLAWGTTVAVEQFLMWAAI